MSKSDEAEFIKRHIGAWWDRLQEAGFEPGGIERVLDDFLFNLLAGGGERPAQVIHDFGGASSWTSAQLEAFEEMCAAMPPVDKG